jgi:formylglycine-generating enzyme required for sulfatase activity
MDFVWIPPGTFTMGTTEEQGQMLRSEGLWADCFEDEQPAHQVTISKGFYLGKYEITQAQWEAVTGTRPWLGQRNVQENPNGPAVWISWNEWRGFVYQLNQALGEAIYRLPTEAEWEFACRAGTTTRWSFGDDEAQLGKYAWYSANSVSVGAHAVGTKSPSPWELYDMHGNVLEWVQDWWSSEYSTEPQLDPTGAASGTYRVSRGGYFANQGRYTRSADRFFYTPDACGIHLGARLVRTK